jgi:hypothetical protein
MTMPVFLQAERDENACRKDLTPSEAVSIGRPIEELERKPARERQGTRTDLPQHSGNFPEGDKGQTRDKIGSVVGMSGRTYEKAKAVVDAAEKDPGLVPVPRWQCCRGFFVRLGDFLQLLGQCTLQSGPGKFPPSSGNDEIEFW